MGFLGYSLVILFVLGLIILGAFVVMIFSFVFGLIQKKKGKKSGKRYLILSGIIFTLFASTIIYFVIPKIIPVETPDGNAYVWSNQVKKCFDAVNNDDVEALDKCLEKNPALLYYSNENSADILHIAARRNQIDAVKCMIDHGAYFDNGINLSNNYVNLSENRIAYSLDYYFFYSKMYYHDDYQEGSSLEMIKLMLDNGAQVNYDGDFENPNALFSALMWATDDEKISDEEIEVFELLLDTEADTKAIHKYGCNLLEAFYIYQYSKDVTGENADKLASMLGYAVY